jgi:hypothetical protein
MSLINTLLKNIIILYLLINLINLITYNYKKIHYHKKNKSYK